MDGLKSFGAAIVKDPVAGGDDRASAVLHGNSPSEKLSEWSGLGLHVLRNVTSGGAAGGFNVEHLRAAKGGIGFFTTFKIAALLKIEHGSGFVIACTADGSWSAPCFYKFDFAGVGISAGMDDAEQLLLFPSATAMEPFMRPDKSRSVEMHVGGRPESGAGLTGEKHLEAWMSGGAADKPVVYSINSGFIIDVSAQGGRVKVNDKLNQSFYGRDATPATILAGEVAPPTEFAPLYSALAKAAK